MVVKAMAMEGNIGVWTSYIHPIDIS